MKIAMKLVALALVLAAILSICVTAQAATSTMYVNCGPGEHVNLRTAPSMSGQVMAHVPHGTAVQAETYIPSWHKVTYQGITGYMMSAYLSTKKPTNRTINGSDIVLEP